jgi:hypothetical protein
VPSSHGSCSSSSKAQGGPVLKQASATSVAEIIDAIQVFSDTTTSSRWLVQPTVRLYSDALAENTDEVRKGVPFCDTPPHVQISSLKYFYGALGSLMTLTLPKLRTSTLNLMPTILTWILQSYPNSIFLLFLLPQKSSSLTVYRPNLKKKLKSRKKNGRSSSSDSSITMFAESSKLRLLGLISRILVDHAGSEYTYWVHRALSARGCNGDLRSQPKGMRSATPRVSKVESAWYLQAQTRRSRRDRSCAWEGLAT